MSNDCENVAGQEGPSTLLECLCPRRWSGLDNQRDNRRCRVAGPAATLDTFDDCYRWTNIVKMSLGREVPRYLQIVTLHVHGQVLTNGLTIVAVALLNPARPLPCTDTFDDCHRWTTIVKLSLGRKVLGYLQIVPLHVDSLVLTNDLTIVAVALVDASNRPHLFVRLQCNNHESDAMLTPDTSAEYFKYARTVISAMGEDLFSVVQMRRC